MGEEPAADACGFAWKILVCGFAEDLVLGWKVMGEEPAADACGFARKILVCGFAEDLVLGVDVPGGGAYG